MVRPPLSERERLRGERLGGLLRDARGRRSMAEVAAVSGVPVETLRKIETGRISTPAFFTVAALASALGLELASIAAKAEPPTGPQAGLPGEPPTGAQAGPPAGAPTRPQARPRALSGAVRAPHPGR